MLNKASRLSDMGKGALATACKPGSQVKGALGDGIGRGTNFA